MQQDPIVVAHRGASATHAENTLEAFDAAVVAGAEAVELDVRLTSDGHPVVMHDPIVARTTDGRGPIRSLSLVEVERLRIVDGRDGDLRVPSLMRVLEALSGRAGVVAEIKNLPGEPDFDPDDQPAVEATLAALHRAAFVGPVMLVSFNPMSIDLAHRLDPAMPTGLLTAADVEARAAFAFAREHGHPWILPFVGAVRAAGAGLTQEVHDASMRIGTWVVDDPAEAVALMRTGVDAVATNDPGPVVAAKREAFGR